MEVQDITPAEAEDIIEQLRKGVPPRRHARIYSAGHEDFLAAVRKRHLKSNPGSGKIRFIPASKHRHSSVPKKLSQKRKPPRRR